MNSLQSPPEFLQAILEGFVDGILVLTHQRQVLYANITAHRLCHRLAGTSVEHVPSEIWQVCEALIESHDLNPEKLFVIESEVECEEMTLRVRVQWLTLDGIECPCLLVRLQDQNQAVQMLAIAEAQNWRLTQRETQVWILRRSGLSRKRIAANLYISEDTVKKHLGNIKAKRQSYLDEEEWRLNYNSHNPNELCSA
ncbi:response regulator containing a CheY-like receiver domain and an HTH DNA-binding domain [Leptolyngbyaceae cyanobacterium JSC-12]|nr:response regulator containing a CheY-like receiver domain and an HTH DNA-binding domain [Leptolyngbyaceae cyanobacterium JSC-12]